MKPRKKNFIHLLQLLSSIEMQDRYQNEVEVDIFDELICLWFDDFYSKEAQKHIKPLLSSNEKKLVKEFHEFYQSLEPHLPTNYEELRGSSAWKKVREKADQTLKVLNWDNMETEWGFRAV